MTSASGAGPDQERPSAVIVDLDGTLAHMGDRHPFATTGYDLDAPNKPVLEVVRALHLAGHTIVIISGRKEVSRAETERWLTSHLPVPYEGLHLRPDDDERPDGIVKQEIYHAEIEPRFDVLCVLDDRNHVVDMWRDDLGLTCLQVAPGDF
ncbi:polynucleotide kinase [Demequina sp. SO4-18]|uniref:phosphatase domain-containing protein n=1 Tax=Demequina sp. SO4-18 TaxID=3401026 RepID=UPI003B5A3FE5